MEEQASYPNGIRRIRQKRGLTLHQLEEMTGIPNGQISRAERHNTGLSRERWARLAAALEVQPWELHVPIEVRAEESQKNLASLS